MFNCILFDRRTCIWVTFEIYCVNYFRLNEFDGFIFHHESKSCHPRYAFMWGDWDLWSGYWNSVIVLSSLCTFISDTKHDTNNVDVLPDQAVKSLQSLKNSQLHLDLFWREKWITNYTYTESVQVGWGRQRNSNSISKFFPEICKKQKQKQT